MPPQQDADQYFSQFAPQPAAPVAPAQAPQAAEQYFNQFAPPQAQQAPPAPTGQSAPGLWPQVWDTAKYVGRRLAQGVLSGIAGDEASNPVTNYLLPGLANEYRAAASPDTTAQVAGVPPSPPNTIGKYAGAVAEAIGQNPPAAAIWPMATLGGALGGTAYGLPGALVGGALGGGLGQIGRAMYPGPSAQEALAARLGPAQTMQEAGEALRTGAQNHMDSALPMLENYAWGPVARQLSGQPVDPSNYLSALEDLRTPARAGPFARSAGAIQPSIIDTLHREAEPLRTGGLDPNLNPLPPVPPTWEEAQYFRSRIGDSMSNPKNPMFNLGADQKDQIYKAITDDMRETARQNNALDQFNSANATSSQLRTHAEQFVKPLLNPDATPEALAKWALQGGKDGGTKLAALREIDPTAVNNLSAAILRTQPRTWTKLAPEAQAALIPDEILRGQVSQTISRMFPGKSSDVANLGHQILGSEAGAALGVLGSTLVPGAGELASGAAGELAGLALPVLGRATKNLLSRPNLVVSPLVGAAAGNNALSPGFSQ